MRVRARIHDVATAAGVSISTVSQALNGRGKISPDTRARVRQAATELGYEPNRIATALQSSRTGILGFVADEIATTPFAGRIVLGAQEEAAARGLTLMVVDSNDDPDVERRQIEVLRAQQVDAFVYACMYNQVRHVPVDLMAPTPIALVNVADIDADVPSVLPDEHEIGVSATRLLLQAGHRRIAHVTIDEQGPAVDLRLAGYRTAMLDAGLEPMVVQTPGPADSIAGRHAMRVVEARSTAVTAVFAFNDPMAMGVYQAAASLGLRIPHDLSVVGVDNLEVIASQLEPALSTIELPHAVMGAWAVRAVLSAGAEHEQGRGPALIPAPLIARESVAPPATLDARGL